MRLNDGDSVASLALVDKNAEGEIEEDEPTDAPADKASAKAKKA